VGLGGGFAALVPTPLRLFLDGFLRDQQEALPNPARGEVPVGNQPPYLLGVLLENVSRFGDGHFIG
jgi:hypothetical protein